ncbi:MAG: hypothetical protein C4617_04135 [Candidatus Liberibacter europaeus]|uniref:Uncharacterized protein n=1 Tax=Candidatus Liberibacter europaeus TaxID=744859 RepID=A0A2T4VX94_9HYPH|nr:hypothetical protein [Candidatus Liberibacter europaeus]PTL86394.1 MAG: hypothetical protein C4617_04135 [Candidatus Liberibacter europaeus]
MHPSVVVVLSRIPPLYQFHFLCLVNYVVLSYYNKPLHKGLYYEVDKAVDDVLHSEFLLKYLSDFVADNNFLIMQKVLGYLILAVILLIP